MGHADHSTASPFEISTTPIEVNESRAHRTIEISNRDKPPTGKDKSTGSKKKFGISDKNRRMTVAHVDMGLANKGSTAVVGDDFWSPQNSEKKALKHRLTIIPFFCSLLINRLSYCTCLYKKCLHRG
ncbi:hypothetical protein B9Z55_006432 [Caenorhabditis nigoni]|uniref:Uncharacterized protein n=1 Tax=Caenorhabditis nigoni TaxID=1611254 RepID=A0A2G5V576_9PELO|nr:hypothetical protein B9Z55_006432 [Caenorhabditis nigoni]